MISPTRLTLPFAAVLLAWAPLSAHAQGGAGFHPELCEQEVSRLREHLLEHRETFSERQVSDAWQRLYLAQEDCRSAPDRAEEALADVRRTLEMAEAGELDHLVPQEARGIEGPRGLEPPQ
ncbi:hypothetical protein [Telmatospirillum sp. J64-1]|uniref:hypothetical protein n=1 Tax=Telmatospirillum sp. J64-1 TaxID=2502183 RepID=UPI00115C895F|nr:hypothetical protein [Telmatospirillum sp. J64-1]